MSAAAKQNFVLVYFSMQIYTIPLKLSTFA